MPQNYDFSSPFFSAWIVTQPGTPSEKRYALWTNGDQSDPNSIEPYELTGLTATGDETSLTLSSLAYLSSMTVSMSLGKIPQIEITMTPPLDEARKIVDSTIIEYAVSAIEVEFGYSTGLDGRVVSPRFQGIMQPPNVSFGTDVSITLKGQGTAGYYLGATSSAKTSPKQSRLKHIQDLVKDLPQVQFDLGKCQISDAAKKRLQEEEVVLANSGKSYLHLIFLLAQQVGCWVQMSDKDDGFSYIILVSQNVLTKNPPIAVLALFDFPYGSEIGTPVGARGVFPIMSVSVQEQAGLFLGPWSKMLRAPSVDPTTLEDKPDTEAKPGDKTSVSGPKGKDQIGVKNESDSVSAVVFQPPENGSSDKQTDLETTVDMLSNTNSIGLQLEVETLGIPDAVPAQIFQVQGLGERLNGYYTLFEITHSISSSGYTSSLKLVQNSRLMTQALNGVTGDARQPTADETAPPTSSNIDTPATETISVSANAQ